MKQHTLLNLSNHERFLNSSRSVLYFLDTFGVIKHPMYGTISFHLWPWQRSVLEAMRTQRHVIILKARQLGISELAVGYALWFCRFYASKTVLMISKTEDDAKELLDRAKYLHDNLPVWLQVGSESLDGCLIGKSNTSQFEFVHMIDGNKQPSLIQSLAATEDVGRGRPASLVILDEWAFQKWGDHIWASIKPTISTGGSLIGISTANGLGNVFHRMWVGAQSGQNTLYPIFLPWGKHPERDQVWYDQQKADMERWQLHQEYPSDATEAFIQSGRPVFDVAYLQADTIIPITPIDGLSIWKRPEQDHTYLIAADVAEGIAGGDYDCAVVLDRATGEEAAELHGQWPIDVFAQKLFDLGNDYFQALLVIERNNHGHAVLLSLKQQLYPRVYIHRDRLRTKNLDDLRPGFPTTAQSKAMIIEALARGLRERTFIYHSRPFVDEARVYAYQDNGSTSAPTGYHDDRVMARAIGVWILTQPNLGQSAFDDLAAREERRKHVLGGRYDTA